MTRIFQVTRVEDTRLYTILTKKTASQDQALVSNIPNICQEAADRMKAMYVYAPQYTLHDDLHMLRTTELMAEVLGSEVDQLNVIELALLILSAFFHDQGMVPLQSEIASLEQNQDFRLFRENWLLEHPNYRETATQMASLHSQKERLRTLASRLAELDSAMLTDFLRSTHG